MQKIIIPTDVAEHCRKAAIALEAHKRELDRLWEIWADEDPDPENGDYWHISIDHPDADKMRKNMAQISEFLKWLANFTTDDEG